MTIRLAVTLGLTLLLATATEAITMQRGRNSGRGISGGRRSHISTVPNKEGDTGGRIGVISNDKRPGRIGANQVLPEDAKAKAKADEKVAAEKKPDAKLKSAAPTLNGKPPKSFLGLTFGEVWTAPPPPDAKVPPREIPFEPTSRFRAFDKYFLRLKSGRIADVCMEMTCGSDEEMAAEATECVEAFRQKYGCEFTGKGVRYKAKCGMSDAPEVEFEVSKYGRDRLRVSAKSLRAELFAQDVKPTKAADLNAL